MTNLTRDIQGRLTKITYPDTTWKTYGYDLEGRLNSESSSTNSVAYSHNPDDTVSQIVSSVGASPGQSTVFTYDPAYRRLTNWTSAQSSEVFSYYAVTNPPTLGANRVQQDTTSLTDGTHPSSAPSVTVSNYNYDALDRVVSRALQAQQSQSPITQSWTYDALGRLIADSGGLDNFTYTYGDATARVKARTSAGGPQMAASYFPPTGDGGVQQLTYSTPAGVSLAQYAYQYDANHNVTSFTEGGSATTSYAYDPYNQLTHVNGPGAGSRMIATLYGYDPAGNLTNESSTGALLKMEFGGGQGATKLVTDTQYGNSNEITTTKTVRSGLATLTTSGSGNYDASGDLLSLYAPVYTYDSFNRLATATSGNAVSTFTYDGIGRVVQVVDQVSGAVVANHSYAWCGNERCVELDNTNQIPSSNSQTMAAPAEAYFKQGMMALQTTLVATPNIAGSTTAPPSAGPQAYYATDRLGSVWGIFAANNAIIASYAYDPYGNRTKTAGTGLDSDFGFAGYFHHAATGLDLTRNRVYDAQLGRWLTRDPIGYGLAFASGTEFNATDLNLYAYAGNNSTSRSDPSGFQESVACAEQCERANNIDNPLCGVTSYAAGGVGALSGKGWGWAGGVLAALGAACDVYNAAGDIACALGCGPYPSAPVPYPVPYPEPPPEPPTTCSEEQRALDLSVFGSTRFPCNPEPVCPLGD
jgi:RHS repeat-associated protein